MFIYLRLKARRTIAQAKVHLVVANELHSRAHQVVLVSSDENELTIEKRAQEEIEAQIVEQVSARHYTYLASQGLDHDDEHAHLERSVLVPHYAKIWQGLSPNLQHYCWEISDTWQEHEHEIKLVIVTTMISYGFNLLHRLWSSR